MLRAVLQAVETASGPITLAELSRQLGIDPDVLDGMLQHWARKGRLVLEGRSAGVCSADCAALTCACGGGFSGSCCPMIARLPRSYSVVTLSNIQHNSD